MSVLMTLRWRDAIGQILRWISVITLVPFDLKRTNSAVEYTWGRGVFLGVSRAPRLKGQGPVVSHILEVLFSDVNKASTVETKAMAMAPRPWPHTPRPR